jgi:myo-inositol 2-dehydrogenase/D-chiro-inositol 1-dehydrogenase
LGVWLPFILTQMRKDRLRVGLLGFGNAARWLHFPVLHRLPQVELAVVAEPQAARRSKAQKLAPGILVCEDLHGLADAGLDAVVICTPNPQHATVATQALALGLDVYLEKPMAISLPEAERLVSIWKSSDRIGMLGMNYRFGKRQAEVRDAALNGRLGDIVAIRGMFGTRLQPLPAWKQQRASGGGALLDLALHHLDLACWILRADPLSVSCRIHSHATEHDTVLLETEFPGGVGAQFVASLCVGETDVFEIHGTKERVILDRHRTDRCEFQSAGLERMRLGRFQTATAALFNPGYWLKKFTPLSPEDSYRRAMEVFIDACLTRTQVQPDFSTGLRLAQIVDAAERSARQRERVYFAEFKSGPQVEAT